MSAPALSVIVPTRNRADAMSCLLRALEQQHLSCDAFEVIVVADGCTDRTIASINAGTWPFAVRTIDQAASGQTAARNRGAAEAVGEILVFLDDDVEPEPEVLVAHAALHEQFVRSIGVGYLPPAVSRDGLFGMTLRGWWQSMSEESRAPSHRFTFRDLLTGHFSIPRKLFLELGGFDETFRCHEDYELGLRAIEADVDLRFVPHATAHHHERADLQKVLRRKYDEGVADVALARKHSGIGAELWLGRPIAPGRRARVLTRLAWDHPLLGDLLVRALTARLGLYEHARLRFRWRATIELVLAYWYWRGVAGASGGRAQLEQLTRRAAAREPPLVVDLAAGIEAGEHQIERARPRALRLLFGNDHVADIVDSVGAERLRGGHLRALIARRCTFEYLHAAARQRALPPGFAPRALNLPRPDTTGEDAPASATPAGV
jgi:glycosyltransferase involved in cell wall biosynthesis